EKFFSETKFQQNVRRTAGNLSLSRVGKKEKLKFGRSQATSRLSEVSQSEIWGFFAGKSQIIAVKSSEQNL
ncbi:MAG TPA: hypothetical protein VJK07_02170, partial [Candidatus Nanoarchaeia archaeon]|nr:hypothetical protein [Candidatus Nanoarchaeia archaeon]